MLTYQSIKQKPEILDSYYTKGKSKSETVPLQCNHCRNIYYRSHAQVKCAYKKTDVNFCSRKCSTNANVKRVSVCCKQCNKAFELAPCLVTESNFCTKSCAGQYNNSRRAPPSDETKRKTSESLRIFHGPPKIKKPKVKNVFNFVKYRPKHPFTRIRLCVCCKTFHTKTKQKYCDTCHPNISHYRSRAEFKFNIYEYPDRFDLTLIKKYGWYSPTGNRGKNRDKMNLEGVSRDHLFSVSEGFASGIDPSILAHPANCALILHKDNQKKRHHSSITLDELKERIALWNIIIDRINEMSL